MNFQFKIRVKINHHFYSIILDYNKMNHNNIDLKITTKKNQIKNK